MKIIKITKIEDLKFKGKHPHNINYNYTFIGEEATPPRVNRIYVLQTPNSFFHTSPVEKIEDGVIETLNSKYKLEIIENSDEDK